MIHVGVHAVVLHHAQHMVHHAFPRRLHQFILPYFGRLAVLFTPQQRFNGHIVDAMGGFEGVNALLNTAKAVAEGSAVTGIHHPRVTQGGAKGAHLSVFVANIAALHQSYIDGLAQ